MGMGAECMHLGDSCAMLQSLVTWKEFGFDGSGGASPAYPPGSTPSLQSIILNELSITSGAAAKCCLEPMRDLPATDKICHIYYRCARHPLSPRWRVLSQAVDDWFQMRQTSSAPGAGMRSLSIRFSCCPCCLLHTT